MKSKLTDVFPSNNIVAGFDAEVARIKRYLTDRIGDRIREASELSRDGTALGFRARTVATPRFNHANPGAMSHRAVATGFVDVDDNVITQSPRSLHSVRSGRCIPLAALSIADLKKYFDQLIWIPARPLHPLEALALEATE